MSPPLTTVMVPKGQLGEIAAMRMILLIEGKKPDPVKIEVNVRLIKRKSVY